MRNLNLQKKIYILAICLFIPVINFAQQGQVKIEKSSDIDQLVEIYKNIEEEQSYFTIQLFASIGGLQKAYQVRDKARIDYPNHYVALHHEDQYKVFLGKFKTRLEADRMKQELKKIYPNNKSMLIRPLPKKH
ncbi:MAG: SPOR domain-containing protein [Flavobacteriaceae bacterium]|nr:SPOR domain-containing protein [Flavobacteriaceae bacterium]